MVDPSDVSDLLTEAAREREADLIYLPHMGEQELRYLAEADTLPDPVTDGLEMDEAWEDG